MHIASSTMNHFWTQDSPTYGPIVVITTNILLPLFSTIP